VRGSRKHILEWVGQGDENFTASLMQTLKIGHDVLGNIHTWMPRSVASAKEARLTSSNLGVLTKEMQLELSKWWLVHSGANTPNWDLAAGVSLGGKKGLVLVEAKAHVGELEKGGKRPYTTNRDQGAYGRSEDNRKRIGDAIEQACNALHPQVPGICISRDKCYQISNRIAFAWKLASLGVPVILVYLGFLNDVGMPRPFVSEEHFNCVVRSYLSVVFPPAFLDKPIVCDSATMQVIIRCRPVLLASTAPIKKAILLRTNCPT
jgi:hypothetical protein